MNAKQRQLAGLIELLEIIMETAREEIEDEQLAAIVECAWDHARRSAQGLNSGEVH